MFHLSETIAADLISLDEAIDCVEAAFSSLAFGSAATFPVASARGLEDAQRWAVKTGYDRRSSAVGFKVGTNWPRNRARGLPTHGSTVVLLDPETGFAKALVGAAHLTVLRTAAADAVAVKHLARRDATKLAIVGAGHQALWDARAIALVRELTDVRIASRMRAGADEMAERLRADGILARSTSIEEAVRGADIVVTATPARAPVLEASWVGAGAHISAMGADSVGKQELPLDLLARGRLFCDVVAQSVSIGEFQSFARSQGGGDLAIAQLGDVINGAVAGRVATDDITIFDSSGTAIQDLAICQLAFDKADRAGAVLRLKD